MQSLFPSISLAMCGLIFTIVISIIYISKKRYENIENKVYRIMLIINFIVLALEIIYVFSFYYLGANSFINEFVCRLYIALCCFWLDHNLMYMYVIFKNKKYEKLFDMYKEPFFISTFLLFLVCFIVSCFLPLSFTGGKDLFIVVGGAAIYPIFVVSIFYVLYFSYLIYAYRKEVRIEKVLSVIFLISYFVITLVRQYFFVDFNDFGFVFTFCLIAMYLTLENQDIKLLKEIELLKEKSEILDKEKTEFLSQMSHEIRIPMNVIMGFTDALLESDNLTEEMVKEDVKHIHFASKNLLEIINNILNISRLESKKEIVENKNYYIGNMLFELVSVIVSKIDKNNVEFVINVDERIPSKLFGDEFKIYQVLLNVLNNSVKFTKSGNIKLDISCEFENDLVHLTFKISDTGYGIKEEDFNKLFKKFTKLETSYENDIEGTGLGLIITKMLVDLLDGEITFDSTYGSGTTFTIKITQKIIDRSKIGNLDEIAKITTGNSIEFFDCSNYNVLIVDDNNINLKVSEKLLKSYNFNIKTCSSGKECIEKIKSNEKYDLIFLDHMMPEMDGIETIHVLKKLENFKVPPVIALTANLVTGLKEKYLMEGFDDYLSKPIDTKELNKIIVRYFKDRKE